MAFNPLLMRTSILLTDVEDTLTVTSPGPGFGIHTVVEVISMRAMMFKEYGDPNVLVEVEVEDSSSYTYWGSRLPTRTPLLTP
jgi:hypothetical protein